MLMKGVGWSSQSLPVATEAMWVEMCTHISLTEWMCLGALPPPTTKDGGAPSMAASAERGRRRPALEDGLHEHSYKYESQ
eukprot:1112335-Amphidinium_carterae.1